MVAFVIQANTPPDPSTEQVKVASSPGQTQRLLGETDPPTTPTKRISAGSNSGRHYCTELHVRIILLLAHKRIALIITSHYILHMHMRTKTAAYKYYLYAAVFVLMPLLETVH